jgi:SAM-dependent methyltransferase
LESEELSLWRKSAEAWVRSQGEEGDSSRREILDPALDGIWPALTGKRVLDVGCGEGRYCRKLSLLGAETWGVDPVAEFIELARKRHPGGEYRVGSAESLEFASDSFDFTLSYLSLVDIPRDDLAASEMVRVTKPGGEIVVVSLSNLASPTENWVKDASGTKLYRTVDRYMDEFPLELAWSGISIRNYHRPLSRTLSAFLSQGAVLTRFLEPLPDAASPQYADEWRVPTFQIYSFRKECY